MRGNHYFNVVARLKPGVSVDAADSYMAAVASASLKHTGRRLLVCAVVVSIGEQECSAAPWCPGDRLDDVAVTAIAWRCCANCQALLLARASVRRGEYALRRSGPVPRVGGWRVRCSPKPCACRSPAVRWAWRSRRRPVSTVRRAASSPLGVAKAFAVQRSWTGRLLAFAVRASRSRQALLAGVGPALQAGARLAPRHVLQQHARGTGGRPQPRRPAMAWSSCRWRPRWCCSSPPA